MSYTITMLVERGEEEIELEVTGTVSKFVRAITHLPHDRCSPAEGGEVEIESITCNGEEWDGELTDKEQDKAEENLFEAQQDDDSEECIEDCDDDFEEISEHW